MTWIIDFLSLLFSGTMAGLFFAWSFSVMNSLKKMPDVVMITFMQTANRTIQNPIFFTFFFGTALLLPIDLLIHWQTAPPRMLYGILLATLSYWLGVMGVTITQNIPLNNSLDKFEMSNEAIAIIRSKRMDFEQKWNSWNHLRTFASFVAFFMLIYAYLS